MKLFKDSIGILIFQLSLNPIHNLDLPPQDEMIQTTISDQAVMILANWQRNNYPIGPKVIDFEGNLDFCCRI